MDSSEQILNEIKEISPLLADMDRANLYALPEGYFEGLADAVLHKIQAADIALPAVAATYQIPENYFESLPQQILSQIQKSNEVQEEMEAIAPLLNTISKQPVFSLPEGYFNQLQTQITHAAAEPAQGKLVNFKTYQRWMQYAAAAMVAGILISGAFLFTDSNSYLEQEKKGRVIQQRVPDTAIDAGILKQDADSSEEVAENISEDEKTGNEVMNKIGNQVRSKSTLELLSDDELKKYLEENAIPETIYPENTEIEDSI